MKNLIKNGLWICITAMALTILFSNILVQFMFGNWLTYGAFTYPFAFLVNDITNRLYGPSAAQKVIFSGFTIGLVCSFIGSQIISDFGPLVTIRIALGSGFAFLSAQLLDVLIFNQMRNLRWWCAPLLSSLLGSTVDTIIFFSVAFSDQLTFIEIGNDVSWANENLPLLGIGPFVPLWVSLALADLFIKIALTIVALIPFRIIIKKAPLVWKG